MNHFLFPSSNQWPPLIHEPMTIGGNCSSSNQIKTKIPYAMELFVSSSTSKYSFISQPSILILIHKVGWRPPLLITRNIFIFHPKWGHTIFPLFTMVHSLSFLFPQCTHILPHEVLVSPPQSSYDFFHSFVYSSPTPRFNSIDLRLNGFKVWKHLLHHHESTAKLF